MLNETPISVLEKQILLYGNFIYKLKSKEDISQDADQQKIDELVNQCVNKIAEFSKAVSILKKQNDNALNNDIISLLGVSIENIFASMKKNSKL